MIFYSCHRNINDPEHPLTLEQLNVVELAKVDVDDAKNKVSIARVQLRQFVGVFVQLICVLVGL